MKLNEDERKAFRSDELLVGIVKGDAIAHRCRVKHFLHIDWSRTLAGRRIRLSQISRAVCCNTVF